LWGKNSLVLDSDFVQNRRYMFKVVVYFIILVQLSGFLADRTGLSSLLGLPSSTAFGQTSPSDVDDSFDPFADYNEFDQETEEEADIHFLRNGRYLTLAFVGGYRGFVGGGFAQAYRGAMDYGVEFNYFFDLNLAMSMSYITGDHAVNFRSTQTEYSGSVNIQMIDLHLKYFFNTDNVTKGLAELNPYGLLGGGLYVRSYSLSQSLNAEADRVPGFKAGAGIEIPLLRRRAYLGFQATYRYVQFPDENKRFIEEGENNFPPISPTLDGDIFELSFLLGTNF
jgi:hypothetical protein